MGKDHKSAYAKKLRDPRWQKTRLKVLDRDKWMCQECYDISKPLNVHHCYYDGYKNPWEYPLGSLVTLCEDCHKSESDPEIKEVALDQIDKFLKEYGYLTSNIFDVGHLLAGIPLRENRSIFFLLEFVCKYPEIQELINEKHREYFKSGKIEEEN